MIILSLSERMPAGMSTVFMVHNVLEHTHYI